MSTQRTCADLFWSIMHWQYRNVYMHNVLCIHTSMSHLFLSFFLIAYKNESISCKKEIYIIMIKIKINFYFCKYSQQKGGQFIWVCKCNRFNSVPSLIVQTYCQCWAGLIPHITWKFWNQHTLNPISHLSVSKWLVGLKVICL